MDQILKELKKSCSSCDELSIGHESTPEAKIESDEIDNLKIKYSSEIKYSFNELGDVWPVVAYLADTSEEVEKVVAHLRS